MDEESAFLRAICEHRDDDVPRLVFSDWLEERDTQASRDRATFIRTQIELSKLGDGGSRAPELRGRAYRLMDLYHQDWINGLPAWARRPVFERGFVSVIEARAFEWLADRQSLFDRVPLLGVCLLRAAEVIDELKDDPYLRRLRKLDLRFNGLGDGGARRLAASPYIDQLDTLELWYNDIADSGAFALANSIHLRNLRVLTLGGNEISDAGARSLIESPTLRGLEQIVLYENRISPDGRAALRDRFGEAVWMEMESEE